MLLSILQEYKNHTRTKKQKIERVKLECFRCQKFIIHFFLILGYMLAPHKFGFKALLG